VRDKGPAAIFQIKTSTAVGLLEQAFYFPRPRYQIIHFGYLALREYLPAVERRNPFAKSVEELLHLINSEPRPLSDVDDGQVVQDTRLITALPADALGVREQANLLVVANCGRSQARPASYFANGHVRHMNKSLDLKCTLSGNRRSTSKFRAENSEENHNGKEAIMNSKKNNGSKSITPPSPLIVKIAIATTFINSWIIFEEIVVDRTRLWHYMPFYRVGLFCTWDVLALAVILAVVFLGIAPFRRAAGRMIRKVCFWQQ
jgi:hypothetical protein